MQNIYNAIYCLITMRLTNLSKINIYENVLSSITNSYGT